MLATKGAITDYDQYVKECKHRGILYFNQEAFNKFFEDCGRVITKVGTDQ